MAEEISLPIKSAGMATLRRMDLDAGVEPDSSFYITYERQMRRKFQLDLTKDPPPDLAIEVEVTRRLGARKSIYRELGVPQVWVYSPAGGLNVLIKGENAYFAADRSPTFPLISPAIGGFIQGNALPAGDDTLGGQPFKLLKRSFFLQ